MIKLIPSAFASENSLGDAAELEGNLMLGSSVFAAFREREEINRPRTFRLPKPGKRDPYFGLPRTKYYELEKAGTIRLVRLRKRGYARGTTLIPFDQVLAYVRGATAEAK